jgi:cysteine-rich repeat protein
MTRHAIFATILVTISAGTFAADQTIVGRHLVVKNPGAPQKRSVLVTAKETASPNTLVGNPTLVGGGLSITLDGAAGSIRSYLLHAGNSAVTGKPFWTGDGVKGFTYRDPQGENSAVKLLHIRKSKSGVFTVKAVLSGKNGDVNLPPNPGTGGCALLGLGGGDSYSIRFADGAITNKGAKLFRITLPTSEGTCFFPTGPTTTSTTTSTTSTTTTSSTTTSTIPSPCGDGALDGVEECDDGGTTPGDGCDGACVVEPGYECTGEPSVCTTT